MSDNRKYYYLKLKENYFDDDSIVLLESMQDGVLYSNILLKLYLKSLKHGGRLQLDEDIPYTAQMIATIDVYKRQTYGLQGWNVSIQSSLHYASSIYNLTFLQMFFISVILNIFGIVALTTITLFLSAQMSSPVTALITSCVICFLPVVFDFNDSLPVLQKMQEICPIFMLHTNGIFSDMKTYFGMSQPVFMIILNVGLIFVFYRLTKNISKKHQVTG